MEKARIAIVMGIIITISIIALVVSSNQIAPSYGGNGNGLSSIKDAGKEGAKHFSLQLKEDVNVQSNP